MDKEVNKKIVFADGSEYYGYGFGYDEDKVCEIVFNTSMVGYQEILSDPSYTYQMVVMTYPIIGNYGITDDDYETKVPTIGAMVVRDYNDSPSNFRYTQTLGEVMEEYKIPGIYGVDTRKLTRSIRDYGSRKALLTDAKTPLEDAVERIKACTLPTDAVAKVSCKKKWYSRTGGHKFTVVALDCGIKLGIIRSLNKAGCNVTVVPYNTPAEEILSLKPDGVFLSNGPGNPTDVPCVIETTKKLIGKIPLCGVCLGHQMISLAYGGKTYKLKFGHRGANHPVKNLLTGKVEMTSQNHSYAVDPASLKGKRLQITHINLLDSTVEGARCEQDMVLCVQYHPESAPGPTDGKYIFDEFSAMMKGNKANAKTN